jgi:hypothetical protein
MISIRKRYLYLSIISLDSSYQQGEPRERLESTVLICGIFAGKAAFF